MDARIDVAAMFAGVPHTSDDVMVDNSTGTITVFLVDDFRRACASRTAPWMSFNSGDSNAVLRRNVWMNKDCAPIHFWRGRAATVLNKGSSAALAKEIHVVQDKKKKKVKLCQVAGSDAVHTRNRKDTRGHRVAQPEQRVCGG